MWKMIKNWFCSDEDLYKSKPEIKVYYENRWIKVDMDSLLNSDVVKAQMKASVKSDNKFCSCCRCNHQDKGDDS